MAAPVIAASGTVLKQTSGTTATVAMPAGVVAGDLLVVMMSLASVTTVTPPAPWREISRQTSAGTWGYYIWIAQATGTDSFVATVPSAECMARCFRITGHIASSWWDWKTGTGLTGTTAAPDPTVIGNLKTTVDYLILEFVAADMTGSGQTCTAVSSGYTDVWRDTSSNTANGTIIGVGSKAVTGVATEDPGVMALSASLVILGDMFAIPGGTQAVYPYVYQTAGISDGPNNAATGTSQVVTMTAHEAGDLPVIQCSGLDVAGAAWTASNGFTAIEQNTGTAPRLVTFAKVATSAAETCTVTKTASNDSSMNCMTIKRHGVTNVATDIKKGTVSSGTSTTPDPPSVSGGSTADWMALVQLAANFTVTGDAFNSGSSALPANYGWAFGTKSASSTSSVGLMISSRYCPAASSEDPGAFTQLNSKAWKAQTFLIPPAGAPPVTPLSRTFDGVDDAIRLSAGGMSGETFGSRLALIYIDTLATRTILQTDNGGTGLIQFYVDGSGFLNMWNTTTAQNTQSLTGGITTGKWWLVGMTKATGSATPRFHFKNITDAPTGAWTHANGGAAMGDWGAVTTRISIGVNNGTGELFDGDIFMVALWKNVVLTDGQFDGLTAYAGVAALTPTVNVSLAVAVATGVTDSTGGGANQSAIVGTTATANDPPAVWGAAAATTSDVTALTQSRRAMRGLITR